jgi:hypothetical protein
MAEGQACVICHTRRPRRYCLGVAGHICAICCGTEREKTVSCPLECPYLREARAREKETYADPREFPNQDIQVDEEFLARNEALLLYIAVGFAELALATEGAVDVDVREAIASLVQTYKTLQSGLVYESRPDNPIAARIQSGMRERIRQMEDSLKQNNSALRDSDVLGVLVFLQRVELQKNNRRPKSRAFIDFLREFLPAEPPREEVSSLILP